MCPNYFICFGEYFIRYVGKSAFVIFVLVKCIVSDNIHTNFM